MTDPKVKRLYYVTVVVLVSLNVFLVSLIVVTNIFRSKEKDRYTKDSDFCLRCSDVLGHPDDGVPEGIVTSENGTKCCAKDEGQLHALVRAYTNTWHDKKIHQENPRFSKCQKDDDEQKPLIKLVLRDKQDLAGLMDVDWEVSMTRHPELVTYGGGLVTIHKTGLYHIYSQVSIQFDPRTAEYPDLPKQHMIIVNEVGSPIEQYRLVVKGSNTQCRFEGQDTGQKHNSTSYVATQYSLQRGDRVSVRVFDRNQLIPSKHMNFFGLHMI